MLKVILSNVIILNVVILKVIMLSVVAPAHLLTLKSGNLTNLVKVKAM
jgi:hypothetical protein